MTTRIDVLDTDGALREAEAAIAGDTRASFLRKAAVGGGAALTSGAILGMLPELATAAKPSKKNDIAILNFALTLEYLERDFYLEAVGGGALSGDVLGFAQLVAAHESTHVIALRKTITSLGGRGVAHPKFNFMGTTGDQQKFLATSFVLENTGVHAYLGQAGNLKSKALLKTAAAIVTVEARHAAAVAGLIGQKPYDLTGAGFNYTPQGAFDTAWSKKRVLKNVGKTGFIVS